MEKEFKVGYTNEEYESNGKKTPYKSYYIALGEYKLKIKFTEQLAKEMINRELDKK